MSEEVAQIVVAGITLAGAIVWLFSLTFLVQSARVMPTVKEEGLADPPMRNLLAGRSEVDGEPRELVCKAAALLAKGTMGPLKIVAKTDDRLVIERLDSSDAYESPGRWFRRGELHFTRAGNNRCQVDWAVEPGNFQRLLKVASVIQVLGLVALVAGCWALMTFVATSPEPGVRWQSVQMLQAVHVLWPPFVFASRYRRGIKSIAAEFEALASNLPYLAT